MRARTVVYDACVLYPAPLRDLLMHLALTGLFRAKWSNQIHDEWIRNVLINRPDLSREQLERTRHLMNAHAMDCLVSGFEHLIPRLDLPDPDDRHVVAAAIHTNATSIVTFNVKDFPSVLLQQWELVAQHPDDFIIDLMRQDLAAVLSAAARHRQTLKNPPKSPAEYLDTMTLQGLEKTVATMRGAIDAI